MCVVVVVVAAVFFVNKFCFCCFFENKFCIGDVLRRNPNLFNIKYAHSYRDIHTNTKQIYIYDSLSYVSHDLYGNLLFFTSNYYVHTQTYDTQRQSFCYDYSKNIIHSYNEAHNTCILTT